MGMSTVMKDGPVEAAEGQAYYVYGIVPSDTSLEGVDTSLGMGGELQLLTEGPVGALVETIDPERPLGRRKDLVAHSSVLNELAARGPVLPMRFGSVVDGKAGVVEELLRPQQEYFASLLEQVTGWLQFNLRARYVLDTVLAEVVEAEPEVAELRRRTADLPDDVTHYDRIRLGELVAHAVEVRRRRDVERILDRLLPHAEDHHARDGAGMDHLAEVSFLVAEDQQGAFEQAAEEMAREMDDRARLSLVGPMALYDFVPEH